MKTKMVDAPQEKIQQCEAFVNDVLKTKLRLTLKAREAYLNEVQEYLQLQTTLENLTKEIDINPLKTKVDLGCGFYVNAEVPDVSKVFVSIGFGFFLELTHEEALSFVTKKVDLLTLRIKALEEESVQITSDIKMLVQTLGQVQGLLPTPIQA
uniref:EOG090X0MWD n=1 Tax=Alona affinis TaxID=381656 RepID=A0A9N6WPK3_9CRUS|nr:EOG090X0MWD [Alona affinis]